MTSLAPADRLKTSGYVLLSGVFTSNEMQSLADRLSLALEADQPSVLRSRGETYGSRDLVALVPEVCQIPRQPVLKQFVTEILGPEAGIVRALFFDKPPGRRWSLPWHQDRTIAVKNNALPSNYFRRPTVKAGIPHVEAPDSFMAKMLALRVHLDPMTADNGPLSVIPGSHVAGSDGGSPVEVHAAAGDVLAMRPLISHCSSLPKEGISMHRRIVHLELAASTQLVDGYEWHAFTSVCD